MVTKVKKARTLTATIDGDAVVGEVAVTGNVPQGGDAGHGGITEVTLDGFEVEIEKLSSGGIRITTRGDAEARVLARQLCKSGELVESLINS